MGLSRLLTWQVTGPDGKTIYEAEREKEGSFQFIALQDGSYRTCFGNTMSTGTRMSAALPC